MNNKELLYVLQRLGMCDTDLTEIKDYKKFAEEIVKYNNREQLRNFLLAIFTINKDLENLLCEPSAQSVVFKETVKKVKKEISKKEGDE